MHHIPPDFARSMQEVYGTAGNEWLDQLPSLLAYCEQRWSLTVVPPFPLSYNYVAPAVLSNGTEIVLKVGFPSAELMSEMEALRLYEGHGIAQLLDFDQERGILLLERLKPGTPLSHSTNDEQATAIAAQVMRQLWRPVPQEHSFPTVAKWASGMGRLRRHFGGSTGPLPSRLVEEAETLFADLLASTTGQVLLHGDLHHDNILSAERQSWLAIDPKGLVGEPAYEVGALMRNQLPEPLAGPEARRFVARRLDQLSEELGIDRARLHGWTLAQAVLSAWWSIEDHGYGWEPAIALAQLLSDMPSNSGSL
ncbi:MAG: aminoglycoside phosphotransferase family protein [Chloroflexota bacterium]|nr:aminoglycoside phosphotransferase family protein [Chloroflexota bacterium]